MRKVFLLYVMMVVGLFALFAQSPEKFTYQAVVRNASNQLVTNTLVGVRISILQESDTGDVVYEELCFASTNANGLLTLEIGTGDEQQGVFAYIDWAAGPYFLKTEIDPNGGMNYSVSSTQQLLSVPYALYAEKAGNGFSGDYNDLTNLPEIPENVSAFNNDAGYLTSFIEQQVLTISNDTVFLTGGSFVKLPAAVTGSFSGDYNDLINKPNIPTVPTNVSAFTNDAGYLTHYTETDPQFNAWDKDYNDLINKPTIPIVPTNVSTFYNDAGYITVNEIPVQVNADWNDTSGVAQILNKPTIPTVPTNVSAFTNDAGYLSNLECQEVDYCDLVSSLAIMYNLLMQLQATVDSLQSNSSYYDSTTAGDGLPCPNYPVVTDVDGNQYNTVKIGPQCWMQSNLRTTHFRDGSNIPYSTTNSWTQPRYYQPNATASYIDYNVSDYHFVNHGLYYNWPAVNDSRGICPTGWHVPGNWEYNNMLYYLCYHGRVCNEGPVNLAKGLASSYGWQDGSDQCSPGNVQSQNNDLGFTWLPAGYYSGDNVFRLLGSYSLMWTSSDSGTSYDSDNAYLKFITNSSSSVMDVLGPKYSGNSVRCVKDDMGNPSQGVVIPSQNNSQLIHLLYDQ